RSTALAPCSARRDYCRGPIWRRPNADDLATSAERRSALTAPLWAWAAFLAFVAAMLLLDLLVLHRRAHEVSMREAGIWSVIWIGIGLGFGGLLWAWAGGVTAQAYLAGYLIEKSLSVDNLFLFAAIFSALAIPARSQHRVLMLGIIGALVMRAAFIAAGITLIEAIHPVIYVFGAVLLVAACCGSCSGSCRSPTTCMASGSSPAAAGACSPPRCCWR